METFSQVGQDRWVINILNNKKNGYFLDIGAHDGKYLSNTYLLEKKYGWNGLCIEGNENVIERLKNNRSCKCVYGLLDSQVKDVKFLVYDKDYQTGVFSKILSDQEAKEIKKTYDPEKNKFLIKDKKTTLITNILKENNVPKEIDYLSIDIEGKEINVLETFPFNEYKVKCITVEHNEPHEGPKRQNIIRNILTKNGFSYVKGNDDVNNWGHGPIDDYYINEKLIPNNYKKGKIGILVKKFQHIFNCGITQQSYFTYKVLKNAGFDVELISAEDDYKVFELTNTPIRKLTMQSDLSDLSMILFVSSSVSGEKELNFIRSFNIKIVNQVCGNYYFINQEDLVHDCFKRNFYENSHLVDEYWILPMYDHMKSYIETVTKCPVKIMNYVWDSEIIDIYMKKEKKNSFSKIDLIYKDNLNLLIAEPNLSVHKTCLIPMCIAEKYEYINKNIKKVYLLCKNKNSMFNKILGDLDIVKRNKVEFHNRMILLEVLDQLRNKNIPITLVSHQINNDLNFLHLELMHLQYPIVHNCPRLKNYGYYYRDHNVDEGYRALEDLNNNYDKNKCDYSKLLWKFHTKNTDNINFYKQNINRILGIKEKTNKENIIKTDDVASDNLEDAINDYLKSPVTNITKFNNEINSKEKIFTKIYNDSNKPESRWGNSDETVSGPGSTIENTAYIRHEVKNIIRKYNISSILDIGCGDFNWMKLVLNKNNEYIKEYTGIDIVKDIIESNIKNYSNEKIKFYCNDVSNNFNYNDLNQDLVICKEVLIHLSFQNSFNFFKNLKKSNCKYLLTTFFNSENRNIDNGDVYNINLLTYPFNFPKPLFTIDERGTLQRFDNSKRKIEQYMGLWKIEDIPDFD